MDKNSTASERIVITRREHLELLPWQAPAPGPAELRVRVSYSAVSFGDVMLRRHVFRDRPAVTVPGYEVVGTIEAAGAGVVGMHVGDRVAAFIEYGGNARHALVRASDAVVLPDAVDEVRAAAVILNYATAIGMIDAAGLVRGDDFFIHGATGGVGSATLDVGRALGLSAMASTRGDRGADLFGARLLDARSPSLVDDVRAASGGGVRAVFDARAGRSLWQSRAMLERGGSLIVFGLSAAANRGLGSAMAAVGTLASLGLFRILPGKRSALFAMDRTYRSTPARTQGWVRSAIDMLAAGAIAPVVAATLPLAQVAEAHRMLERGAVVGKLVIDCR